MRKVCLLVSLFSIAASDSNAAILRSEVTGNFPNAVFCVCTAGRWSSTLSGFVEFDETALADNFVTVGELVDWSFNIIWTSNSPLVNSENVTVSAGGPATFFGPNPNRIDYGPANPIIDIVISPNGGPWSQIDFNGFRNWLLVNDPDAGNPEPTGLTTSGSYSISAPAAAVPEPGGAALLGGGFAGAGRLAASPAAIGSRSQGRRRPAPRVGRSGTEQ